MRDLALMLILLGLVSLAWWRPWLGMLGLTALACMHPQGYGSGAIKELPVFFILFAVTTIAAIKEYVQYKSWPRVFWDWRLAVLAMLWGHFVLTTQFGLNPWAAWPKLWAVMKTLPFLLMILLLIDIREKLYYLNVVMALSIAVVVLKGGYWAVMTGFQDRVYGPPGSQYGDNNEFAVATAMAIPLLMLWYRQIRHAGLRWVVGGLIALGFAAALSSWSRGGLLSLGVVAVLLLWHSRRKWLALPLLGIGVALMFVNLPEAWFARMGAIGGGAVDASAQARLDVWRLGWRHVLDHPWFGSGFEGWIYLSLPMGGSLDWHSAYVEMAVEHGLVGLGLWGLLLFGSVLSLSRLIWSNRRWKISWLTGQAAMLRAALAAYAVGAAFLGIAYWELLYLLVLSAILTSRFAQQERRARIRSANSNIASTRSNPIPGGAGAN